MIAYVFPGQGSQFAGMGRELAAESEVAAEVLRTVQAAVDFPLTDLMFGENAQALLPTEVQQPAIFAHSMAALAVLRQRHEAGPDMVAGHSLGEYSAVVAAGCLDLEPAARLVRLRGELMGRVGARVGGAMVAVMGLDDRAVEALAAEARTAGTLGVANYNCPGQVVLSGETAAVAAVRELVKERGGKAIPLQVSGAFHSPLMEPVVAELRPHIEAAPLRDAALPLVSNVDAVARCDAAGIKQALVQQVTGSVRWTDSVQAMVARGVDIFVEVGPGNVLARLIGRICGEVRVFSAGTPRDIDLLMESIC